MDLKTIRNFVKHVVRHEKVAGLRTVVSSLCWRIQSAFATEYKALLPFITIHTLSTLSLKYFP